MKCTTRMYAYHVKYEWQRQDEPAKGILMTSATCGDSEHTLVGPVDIEYDIPDDFDPRPQQIKALQEKAEKVRADFAKNITEIQAQIASLTAIEYVQEAR